MADGKSSLDLEALRRAIDGLVVNDIRLQDSRLLVREEFDPKITDGNGFAVRVNWGPKRSAVQHLTDKQTKEHRAYFFKVYVGTAIRLLDTQTLPDNAPEDELERHTVAVLEATFLAEYQMNSTEPIPKEAQTEFAKTNAPYHVWPFWREFAYSTFGRSGIIGVMLPMMVIRQGPQKTDPPGDPLALEPDKHDSSGQ